MKFIRKSNQGETWGGLFGLIAGVIAWYFLTGFPTSGLHGGGAISVFAGLVIVPLSVLIFSSIGGIISNDRQRSDK